VRVALAFTHDWPQSNPTVHKGRLEAFSDGVLAIIITIMVLELHAPHEPTLAALRPLVPVLLSYVLSFIYVGIYWNNHHHMLQAARRVNGATLWANLHLLFWLSLVPFVTHWMGGTSFAPLPVAAYGADLFFAAVAFAILARVLVREHGPESTLARAVGAAWKERVSMILYAAAIPLAFLNRWIACAIYAAVALIWLIPDRRIERVMTDAATDRPNEAR
jgi:uncharacterized membrane protein